MTSYYVQRAAELCVKGLNTSKQGLLYQEIVEAEVNERLHFDFDVTDTLRDECRKEVKKEIQELYSTKIYNRQFSFWSRLWDNYT